MRYLPPKCEHEFEDFCLDFFQEVLAAPTLDKLGRRGQRQHGIDLIETAARSPRHAVQCKHHVLGKVATASELREEVVKARTFPERIDEYHFATTSPRDAELQVELIRLNEEQKQAQGFEIFYWPWERFERRMDKEPSLALHLPGTPIHTSALVLQGVAVQALSDTLPKILVDLLGPRALAPAPFDEQIDEARDYLRRAEYEVAQERLEGLRTRAWDKLDERQRYRVLANLGSVKVKLDKPLEGAALYLQAASHQPDDLDAHAFQAMAQDLMGDQAEAFRIAEGLVIEQKCKRAAAVFVRCAPDGYELPGLMDAVRPWLDELDVLVSLVVRGINKNDYALAAELAERLDSAHPREPWGPLFGGKALLVQEQAQFHVAHRGPTRAVDAAALERAERLLTDGIERCTLREHERAKGEAYVDRARARWLLNRLDGEQADLEEAQRLIPNDPDVIVFRAGAVIERDRQRGIALLRDAVKHARDERPSMFLAGELAREPSTRGEAIEILLAVAGTSSPLGDDALIMAVGAMLRDRRFDDASSLLAARAGDGQCLRTALDAAVALARGEQPVALQLALRAVDELLPAEGAAVRRSLATTLTRLAEYRAALRIWKTLAVPGVDSPDMQMLLNCAFHADDQALILEQCRLLRENSRVTPQLIELESGFLQYSDPDLSYRVLRDYITANPSDRRATLRFSFAALRIGMRDEVVTSLDRLPEPEDDLATAGPVIGLLVAMEKHDEAVRFAYEVVRAHWQEPDAHHTFVVLLAQLPETHKPAQPTAVVPGTAVCFAEVPGGASHWLVIEDGPTLRTPEEARPDSARAAPFLGRTAHDRFPLSSGVQERQVEVVEVVSKYVFRFRDCAEQFQLRFPDRHDVQVITIGPEGEPLERRFSGALRASDLRADHVRPVLGRYETTPTPLAVLSSALGEDPIQCQLSLATSAGTTIWAGDDDHAAFTAALAEAAVRDTALLDISAAATILLLGLHDQLGDLGWRLAMTYSTRDLLVGFVKSNAHRKEGGRIGRSPAGIAFEPFDAERWARLARQAQRVADLCRAVAAPGLATLETDERKRLTGLLGQWGAETVAASTQAGRVVWSDDVAVTIMTRRQGGVALGTQGILAAAAMKKTVAVGHAHEIAARLIGYGYRGVWLAPGVMKAACRLADCDPSRSPLATFLDLVRRDDLPLRAAAQIALVVMKELYDAVIIPERRSSFATAVLEAVAARQDASLVIAILRRALPVSLGINVMAAAEAMSLFDAWLRQRRM